MNEYSKSTESRTNDRPSSPTHWVLIGFLAVAVLFLAMDSLPSFLFIAAFFYLMMRCGCGTHMVGCHIRSHSYSGVSP